MMLTSREKIVTGTIEKLSPIVIEKHCFRVQVLPDIRFQRAPYKVMFSSILQSKPPKVILNVTVGPRELFCLAHPLICDKSCPHFYGHLKSLALYIFKIVKNQ